MRMITSALHNSNQLAGVLQFHILPAGGAVSLECLSHPCSQQPSKECEPYAFRENKPIAPCGAIANSMFNGEPVSCCVMTSDQVDSHHHHLCSPLALLQTRWSCFTTVPTARRSRFHWPTRASPGGPTSTWSSGTLEPTTQTSLRFSKVGSVTPPLLDVGAFTQQCDVTCRYLCQAQWSRWTGAGPSTSWTPLRTTTALSMRTSSCGWEPLPCRPSANSTASSIRRATWFQRCHVETTLWRSSTVSFTWNAKSVKLSGDTKFSSWNSKYWRFSRNVLLSGKVPRVQRFSSNKPVRLFNPWNPDYPVRSFEGRKRMILSTISWMGGKNPFLGIAYITVGSVCFFLGIVLLIIHHKCGNRSNSADISNWDASGPPAPLSCTQWWCDASVGIKLGQKHLIIFLGFEITCWWLIICQKRGNVPKNLQPESTSNSFSQIFLQTDVTWSAATDGSDFLSGTRSGRTQSVRRVLCYQAGFNNPRRSLISPFWHTTHTNTFWALVRVKLIIWSSIQWETGEKSPEYDRIIQHSSGSNHTVKVTPGYVLRDVNFVFFVWLVSHLPTWRGRPHIWLSTELQAAAPELSWTVSSDANVTIEQWEQLVFVPHLLFFFIGGFHLELWGRFALNRPYLHAGPQGFSVHCCGLRSC